MIQHNNIKSVKNKVNLIFADGSTLTIQSSSIDLSNKAIIILENT